MSRRTFREARRYLLAALALEVLLAPFARLRGRLLASAAVACLVFFRDPPRILRPEPGLLYAPADGVVVGIDEVQEPWLAGGDALRIAIFLAVYDVHVTRSPVTGTIAREEWLPGGFWPAFLRRAESNRRQRLAIDRNGRRVVLVQAAGLLARRISSWVSRGEHVTAGQRLALIHLGSRADVLVPAAEARPLVAVGERVRAGLTPVARYVGEAAPA
jgi:phosphatidylserine decarboxylase